MRDLARAPSDITTKEWLTYIAAAIAAGLGVIFIYLPPSTLTNGSELGVALLVGGLGAFGVSVSVPTFYRYGMLTGNLLGLRGVSLAAIPGATFSGVGSLNGGEHEQDKGHGYVHNGGLAPGEAHQVAQKLKQYMPKHGGSVPTLPNGRHARLDRVAIMAPPNPGNQTPMPEGDTVVVDCTALDDNFASPQAHETLSQLATWVRGVTGSSKGVVAHFCCVSDM